jgi:pyruvate dehydrogenase E1 component alpha subunit
MMLIRAFETMLSQQRDHGFQLLSTGEEAVAVGLSAALTDKDQLLTGGRSIGPALARGVDPGRLMAELLGKTAGMNNGRAGRGHMADPAVGFFGAHAVVGGNISIAAGVALAMQMDRTGGIVAVMFGDGACGQGALHETLNMAAAWKLPVLFLCNNNTLSVSTERSSALASAKLSDLGAAFGLWAQTVDGMDVDITSSAAREAAKHVRSGAGPAFLECLSIRFLSHSTTARETRAKDRLVELRAQCPIEKQVRTMALDAATVEAMRSEAASCAAEALAFANASSYPDPSEVFDNVG